MRDFVVFIFFSFLWVNYLSVTEPLAVMVNGADSFEPAEIVLMLKLPETLNVPVAPAYLPVPLLTTAFPLKVIFVGALSSSAQPFALESKATLSVSAPDPRVAAPSNVSHCEAGAAAPEPTNSPRSATVPVPVAFTEVT